MRSPFCISLTCANNIDETSRVKSNPSNVFFMVIFNLFSHNFLIWFNNFILGTRLELIKCNLKILKI